MPSPWLNRQKKQHRDVIPAFFLLEELIKYLANWKEKMLSYDAEAEQIYRGFPARLRQELKDDARIAAVALVNGAVIWTFNVSDYSKGARSHPFRCQDWLGGLVIPGLACPISPTSSGRTIDG